VPKKVVRADKIKIRIVQRAHNHDSRNVAPLQSIKKGLWRFAGGTQHHTADVIAHQRINKFLLSLCGFLAISQKKQQFMALHFMT
jgi:putative component of toxin-antitoxin plasmid stabilization module